MVSLKESYIAVLKSEKPERLPLYVANMSDFLQFYYGISARDFIDIPNAHVEVTIRFAEEFNIASIAPAAYILFGCGPEIGVNWQFTGDSLPGFTGSTIRDKSDLEKFIVPQRPSGYFENYIQILKSLDKQIGDRIFIQSFPLGPFAVACFLRGIENALLDPLTDLSFYKDYMEKCVEHSIFIGKHVLDIGLPGNILNEIFLSPDMVDPHYYHKFIAPYDDEVSYFFQEKNQNLPNSFAIFMGKQDDIESQKAGRILFDHFFGTRESLSALRKGMQYDIPGFPTIITLSGRMMASWSTNKIIEFLRDGTDIIIKEYGQYPAIRLTSLQPQNRNVAYEMANTIKAINELIDSIVL